MWRALHAAVEPTTPQSAAPDDEEGADKPMGSDIPF